MEKLTLCISHLTVKILHDVKKGNEIKDKLKKENVKPKGKKKLYEKAFVQ